VLRALEAPTRQIAVNSGVEGSIVVGKILEHKSKTFGFDAQTEQYVDMLNAGIVDPARRHRPRHEAQWAVCTFARKISSTEPSPCARLTLGRGEARPPSGLVDRA
jgi:hypothetical protein